MSIATLVLRLQVKNNSPHLRGRKHAMASINRFVLELYDARRRGAGEYEIKVSYDTPELLEKIVNELLRLIAFEAELWSCVSACEARVERSDPQQ